MDDSNYRLRQARAARGFRSARAAALKHGWTVSTYASHENGQTAVPVEAAGTYARAFKVSAAWILTGEGPREANRLVKVMGEIGAGGEISPEYEQVPDDGLYEVECPFPLPDDAIAFEVKGNSMYPRYQHGDVVLVRNREVDPEAVLNREVAVRTATQKRYIKFLRPGRTRGLYNLESHNEEPIRDVKVVWVAEVISIIRPGYWSKIEIEKSPSTTKIKPRSAVPRKKKP